MRLIPGNKLTKNQVQEVKSAFMYRWTVENLKQATRLFTQYGHGCPTIEPITDEQWLNEYGFYFKSDGHLSSKPNHCELLRLHQ